MTDIKDILFAFSEEIRLRIILLLKDSILCVNCLTESLDLPQPTISRHLALLRRIGVVGVSKDKLHCYYTKTYLVCSKRGFLKPFMYHLKTQSLLKGTLKS